MLTVVTPATSTSLTTLARASAMLGYELGQDVDIIAERCIREASAMVVDYCRRPFARETVLEVFYGAAKCCDGLLLGRSPVTNFASVTSEEVLLTTTDYAYDPELGKLYRSDAAGHLFQWGWGSVSVVYTAGYTLPDDDVASTWTLPLAVERAATLIAGAYLSTRQRDPMVRSETVEGVGATTWWEPASAGLISPEAESLLAPYRRLA